MMTRPIVRQVPPSDFWLKPLPLPRRRRWLRNLGRAVVLWGLAVASIAVVGGALALMAFALRVVL